MADKKKPQRRLPIKEIIRRLDEAVSRELAADRERDADSGK